jgi:hypothetical protein
MCFFFHLVEQRKIIINNSRGARGQFNFLILRTDSDFNQIAGLYQPVLRKVCLFI